MFVNMLFFCLLLCYCVCFRIGGGEGFSKGLGCLLFVVGGKELKCGFFRGF